MQARAATQEATVQGSRQLGQFLQDHPTSAQRRPRGDAPVRDAAGRARPAESPIACKRWRRPSTTQLQRQQRLASWLSVLSPTMVAQGVLLEAAGTSASRFDHFRAEARVVSAAMAGVFRAARAGRRDAHRRRNSQPLQRFSYADAPASAMVRRSRIADCRDGHRRRPCYCSLACAATEDIRCD